VWFFIFFFVQRCTVGESIFDSRWLYVSSYQLVTGGFLRLVPKESLNEQHPCVCWCACICLCRQACVTTSTVKSSAAELTPFLFFVIQLNVKVQVFSLHESQCQCVWSREVFEQQLLFSASQCSAQETHSRENDSLYKSLGLWLALETLETSFWQDVIASLYMQQNNQNAVVSVQKSLQWTITGVLKILTPSLL